MRRWEQSQPPSVKGRNPPTALRLPSPSTDDKNRSREYDNNIWRQDLLLLLRSYLGTMEVLHLSPTAQDGCQQRPHDTITNQSRCPKLIMLSLASPNTPVGAQFQYRFRPRPTMALIVYCEKIRVFKAGLCR